MRSRILICLSLILFLTGCAAVGPDYRRGDPSVPAQFSLLEKGVTAGDPLPTEVDLFWWRLFHDPMLDSLMQRATEKNRDLRIAEARVLQARALARVSSSRLLPEGFLDARYQRVRRTETGQLGQTGSQAAAGGSASQGDSRTGDLFFAAFDASWEIDIFGGVRREIEAADADLASSQEALRDTLVTLRGEIGRNYMELRGLQLRLAIAHRDLQTRRDNEQIVSARARAGLVAEIDAARAAAELHSAEARLSSLEEAWMFPLHRLGVLLGLEPRALEAELRTSGPLPLIAGAIPAGLPSDLLRRRPDIRRAERDLAAATARIGVATADLFPRFSLTGTFGYQSTRLGKLLRDASNFRQAGPSMNWSILNFRRLLATIAVSEAFRDEVLAAYEQRVLLSLEEVENALVTIAREGEREAALADAVKANDLAAGLAMKRYTAGIASYLEVIDALSALYASEDQLVQARQTRGVAVVALYKALGGGWQDVYPDTAMPARVDAAGQP